MCNSTIKGNYTISVIPHNVMELMEIYAVKSNSMLCNWKYSLGEISLWYID